MKVDENGFFEGTARLKISQWITKIKGLREVLELGKSL